MVEREEEGKEEEEEKEKEEEEKEKEEEEKGKEEKRRRRGRRGRRKRRREIHVHYSDNVSLQVNALTHQKNILHGRQYLTLLLGSLGVCTRTDIGPESKSASSSPSPSCCW